MASRLVWLAVLALTACENRGPFSLGDAPLDVFAGDAATNVLVFTQSDCPISNRYAPELSRLYDAYAHEGVSFWLVYPDARDDQSSIETHLESFGFRFTPVRDPHQVLVERIGVTISPEAALFDSREARAP